ncbi:hypothetical protein KCU64_g14859, partial [Aureobasidium melanogenum]
MKTVLFGITLGEMRLTMGGRSAQESGRVDYLRASTQGKIKEWLNVLGETATFTPWKVPQQFLYLTKVKLDYVQQLLCMIEDMLSCPVNLAPLPERLHVFSREIGLLSTSDPSKTPKWLLPHFTAAIRSFSDHEPQPLLKPIKTHTIQCRDSVAGYLGDLASCRTPTGPLRLSRLRLPVIPII